MRDEITALSSQVLLQNHDGLLCGLTPTIVGSVGMVQAQEPHRFEAHAAAALGDSTCYQYFVAAT